MLSTFTRWNLERRVNSLQWKDKLPLFTSKVVKEQKQKQQNLLDLSLAGSHNAGLPETQRTHSASGASVGYDATFGNSVEMNDDANLFFGVFFSTHMQCSGEQLTKAFINTNCSLRLS